MLLPEGLETENMLATDGVRIALVSLTSVPIKEP